MPTMIWSAVMTCFSLPGRLSVSSPFKVFAQGCWSPGRRDLVPGQADIQPLVMRGAFADGGTAPDRSDLALATVACQSRRSQGSNLEQATIRVADRRWIHRESGSRPTMTGRRCRGAPIVVRAKAIWTRSL
jgi:hypothetical protein